MLDGKLQLGEGAIGPAVIEAMTNVVAYARSRIMAPKDDSSRAVHENRKALRRARSLARMLRPSLSRRAQRRLEDSLRAAHRQYADRRDSDSRIVAWLAFAERHHFSVPAATRAFSPGPAVAKTKLAPPLRKPVDEAIGSLANDLPADMTTDHLRRGLKATYRSARTNLKRVANVADPVHVHRLRRRAKDVHNQLELIRSLAPKRAEKWRKRFGHLAKQLGEVTDLYMVRDGLDEVWRAHPELGPELKREIDRALDEEIAERVAEAIGEARTAMADKPSKFSDRFGL